MTLPVQHVLQHVRCLLCPTAAYLERRGFKGRVRCSLSVYLNDWVNPKQKAVQAAAKIPLPLLSFPSS